MYDIGMQKIPLFMKIAFFLVNHLNVNRSTGQQPGQLDVFHQDFKLTAGFEIFLALQGLIFSKKLPKIGPKKCVLWNIA